MAATLSLDTLTSGGAGITVASGKTFTVGGKSITAGSSNIQRATGDVTVATTANFGVAGKSELVIAATPAGPRTITLCPVTETEVDTCIITVVCDADATSTNKLMVVQSDGSTEVWTGYQKGDFVRLIVSNSAWLVVDHKETFFSSRYPAADQTISTGALEKMTGNGGGWTNILDYGGMWNTTDVRLVMPFACFADVNYRIKAGPSNMWRSDVALKAGAAGSPTTIADGGYTGSAAEYGSGLKFIATTIKLAKDEVIEFWSRNMGSNGTGHTYGAYVDMTRFDVTVTRIY